MCIGLHSSLSPCKTAFSCWTISSKASSIFPPHVLGILAQHVFVELLECITLEVIQVRFVVAVTIVLAELQVLVKILKDLSYTWVGFDCRLGHFIFLKFKIIYNVMILTVYLIQLLKRVQCSLCNSCFYDYAVFCNISLSLFLPI